MIEAASLQSIVNHVSRELPRRVTITKREPVVDIGFVTTLDLNRPVRYQAVRISESRDSKLIGILLCHPKAPIAKAEILDHLLHFHYRSGEAVDFFCAGYGAYWPPEHFADQEVVTRIDGVEWLFSEHAFSRIIDELEADTTWKYSGETELLLLPAKKHTNGHTELDFRSAIVCNLEAMARDKAFSSVRAFFADVFRYAKTHSDRDPAWGLSDSKALSVGGSALKEAVLSLIPKALKEAYERGEHYAVRSIARDL